MFEDGKRRKDSLKRITQVKQENEDIPLELEKAQQHIKTLRAEAGMLLKEMQHLKDTDPNDTLKPQKRDPSMPKHPTNVFYAYCRQERPRMKDANFHKVTCMLSKKWKALGKQDQQVYCDIYKKELDDYNAAMKTYHEESEKQSEDQSENPQNEQQKQ